MDESPRWLIVRGRHDQAIQVLRKAARWNRVTLQSETDLRSLMKEIQKEVVRSAKFRGVNVIFADIDMLCSVMTIIVS